MRLMQRLQRPAVVVCFVFGASILPVEALGHPQPLNPPKTSSQPKCEVAGKGKITLDCVYPLHTSKQYENQSQIAIEHAIISFGPPKDDSTMYVELTFRNEGRTPFREGRVVYIQFDDARGQNYIRRVLSKVELGQIPLEESKTFLQSFIAPGLQPGTYLITLCIPSSDPSLKFDASQNLLLSNALVSDATKRLNTVGTITVQR